MTSRRGQRFIVIGLMVLALLVAALLILANYAHRNYRVPLDEELFLKYSLTSWWIAGGTLLGIILLLEVWFALRPAPWLRVIEFNPERTGPQFHVRCVHCGVVHWVEDTGERPLNHFCPNCGQSGSYGAQEPDRNFLYTEIEVKLGCTKCGSAFIAPEPLTRPFYTVCPTCKTPGILGAKAKLVEAEERRIDCSQCGFGYNLYTTTGRMPGFSSCPRCATKIVIGQPMA